MERTTIQEKYTWDLSSIYKTHEEYYQDLEKAKDLLKTYFNKKIVF